MYRIIIIDDEPYTVDSLYNSIQFKLPFEMDVYKAYSAVEALKLLESIKFDIVITDICMPEMDGLELMKIVKSNWPHCRVIFLTGHSEFNYVYTAIKYEGVRYILKYESFDVIFEAIEESVGELDAIINTEELLNKVRRQNDTILPYLQQQFMSDLIHGRFKLDDYHINLLKELKIPLSLDEPVMMVMVYIGRMDESPSDFHNSETLNSIYIIANEYLSDSFNMAQTVCESSIVLWFLQPVSKTDSDSMEKAQIWEKACLHINGYIESIQNACMEKLSIVTSYLVDTGEECISFISKRYHALRQAFFNFIEISADMKIANIKKITDPSLVHEVIECRDYEPLLSVADISRLQNLFKYAKRETALSYLDNLTKRFGECKSMHNPASQEAYYMIAATLHSIIYSKGIDAKISHDMPLYMVFDIEGHVSWEEATAYLGELAEAIFNLQELATDSRMAGIIDKIRQYINDHLSEDLSLVRLAELVYFNPTYLSSMFKQVTGINLVSYINGIRIEKAKELLTSTNIKISDVADRIGCTSSSYFTQFFRREVGISPHDYRENYLIEKKI